MSIRWRESGELLCAAKCEGHEGDIYIDDRLHYQLVVMKVLVPDENEETSGQWHWNGESERVTQ